MARRCPAFQPGQFLTFKLYIEGQPRPMIRTYSLSDSPSHKEYYRVSVKREAAPEQGLPAGISSTHFHDRVEVGTPVVREGTARPVSPRSRR